MHIKVIKVSYESIFVLLKILSSIGVSIKNNHSLQKSSKIVSMLNLTMFKIILQVRTKIREMSVNKKKKTYNHRHTNIYKYRYTYSHKHIMCYSSQIVLLIESDKLFQIQEPISDIAFCPMFVL